MVVKGDTKLTKVGSAGYLLIPIKVLTDSAFPFKFGNGLSVEIKDGKLIVTKDGVKKE